MSGEPAKPPQHPAQPQVTGRSAAAVPGSQPSRSSTGPHASASRSRSRRSRRTFSLPSAPPSSQTGGRLLLLECQVHHDTHGIPMGNYVIGGGNYVIVSPSELGNYVSADNKARRNSDRL